MSYENHTLGVRIQSQSDWRGLDLSLLGASADIDCYLLDEIAGTKDVRIQVKTQTTAEYDIRIVY